MTDLDFQIVKSTQWDTEEMRMVDRYSICLFGTLFDEDIKLEDLNRMNYFLGDYIQKEEK